MKFGIDYFPDAEPDRVSGRQYFDEVLELAEVADELGYDSVKIVEHYFTSYGGYSPDPCLFLAACSQRPPARRRRRAGVHALRVRRLRHLHGREPGALRGGDRGSHPAVDGRRRHLRGEVSSVPERHLAAAPDPAAAPAALGGRGGQPRVLRV